MARRRRRTSGDGSSGAIRGIAARAGLVARVAGALRHAFWLRMHVRRIEMITQDIRYGWRLMVRKPAFAARRGAHARTRHRRQRDDVQLDADHAAAANPRRPRRRPARRAERHHAHPHRSQRLVPRLSRSAGAATRQRRGSDRLYARADEPADQRRRSAAHLRSAGERQLLQRARRPAGARPRVPSRGRHHAQRTSGRGASATASGSAASPATRPSSAAR